jgi:hypothetical protein
MTENVIDILGKCILGKYIIGNHTISVISTCYVKHVHPAILAIYMKVTPHVGCVVFPYLSVLFYMVSKTV